MRNIFEKVFLEIYKKCIYIIKHAVKIKCLSNICYIFKSHQYFICQGYMAVCAIL